MVAQFFLYTKLGQNETKNLKKAPTNRDERRVLAQIFGLQSILSDDAPDKTEVLRLDFHYVNYNFCKENYFSNEKTSTLLAMLDNVLKNMLDGQLASQQGFNILKHHLATHSIQRPPYSIAIFSQNEVTSILQFAQETFLRHISLYEFAFNQRVEMTLRTLPSLADMQLVDKQETEQLKAFPTLSSHLTPERTAVTTTHVQTERQSVLTEKEHEDLDPQVDWAKVGRLYNEKTQFQTVLDREVGRLNKALEAKLLVQEEKMTAQSLPQTGKK